MNLPLAINYELQPKKQQTFAINWVNVINLKPNHQPKFISCHQQYTRAPDWSTWEHGLYKVVIKRKTCSLKGFLCFLRNNVFS